MRRTRPPRPPGDPPVSFMDRVRWFEVKNDSGLDVPGGGLLRVTDTVLDAETDDLVDAGYGILVVDAPDADSQDDLLVAHPAGIAAGGYGLATSDDFVPVRLDPASPASLIGEEWGSEAGSFYLHPSQTGFRIGATEVEYQDLRLAQCWRADDPPGGGLVTKNNDNSQVTDPTTTLLTFLPTGIQTVASTPGSGLAYHQLTAADHDTMGAVSTWNQVWSGAKFTSGGAWSNYVSWGVANPSTPGTLPTLLGRANCLAGLGYQILGGGGLPGVGATNTIGLSIAPNGVDYLATSIVEAYPTSGDDTGTLRVVWLIDGFLTPAGFRKGAIGVRVGSTGDVKIGIDTQYDTASGTTVLVRGGAIVDEWVTGSPPSPPPSPPITPPVPFPPPPAIEVTVVVRDSAAAPIQGRVVTVEGAAEGPQFTDASGEAVFTDVPGVGLTPDTFDVELAGSGESLAAYSFGEWGAGGVEADYVYEARNDLGDLTVYFDITSPDPALDDLAAVVVTVEDGSGPVAGRDVTVDGVTVATDAAGRAVFLGVDPAALTAVCDTPGGETATWTTTDPTDSGSGFTADLALTAAQVTTVEFTLADLPFDVSLFDSDNLLYISGRNVTIGATTIATNVSGIASFTGVPAGSITVTVATSPGKSYGWVYTPAVGTPVTGSTNVATFTYDGTGILDFNEFL